MTTDLEAGSQIGQAPPRASPPCCWESQTPPGPADVRARAERGRARPGVRASSAKLSPCCAPGHLTAPLCGVSVRHRASRTRKGQLGTEADLLQVTSRGMENGGARAWDPRVPAGDAQRSGVASSQQPAFWSPPPAWGELTGGVFQVACQKKMVGGRKCAIRGPRAISTVWSAPHCKHSGGRGCSAGPRDAVGAVGGSRSQQNVPALRRGNINVIIIILCI